MRRSPWLVAVTLAALALPPVEAFSIPPGLACSCASECRCDGACDVEHAPPPPAETAPAHAVPRGQASAHAGAGHPDGGHPAAEEPLCHARPAPHGHHDSAPATGRTVSISRPGLPVGGPATLVPPSVSSDATRGDDVAALTRAEAPEPPPPRSS